MAKSNRENEIKLAFPSPDSAISRLREAGAREIHPRAFEDNTLFDFPNRSLTASGRLLRLRTYGATAYLTFKAPVEGTHRHKVRIEHETEVSSAEATRSILLGLGLGAVYRYQKYRTGFELDAVEASVDETPLGTFVELEGPADDVDRAAEALGVAPSDFIRATYRELQEIDAAARGSVAGDLLLGADARKGSAP